MTVVGSPPQPAAAPAAAAGRVPWLREVLLLGGLYLVFEALRDLVPTRASVADAHALAVLGLERRAHLDVEDALQSLVLPHRWLVDSANVFYASAYVVCTVAALVWAARRHQDRYVFWRNALVATTCLGLVGYYAFPTAPPRLLAQAVSGAGFGIVDTLKALPGPWSVQAPIVSTLGNPYAAMPSLHCAWAVWVALVVTALSRRPLLRLLVWLYPVVTIAVVLVTGNHFVLDVLAGIVVAIAALVSPVARVLRTITRRRTPTVVPAVDTP